MDDVLKDARFAHIAKDPRFRRIPKAERKVKIDKRFQSMFKDKKFTVKYTVDKRGRPTNQTSTENLKKYYELTSSDEDSEDEREKSAKEKKLKKKEAKKKKADSLQSTDKSNKNGTAKDKLRKDLNGRENLKQVESEEVDAEPFSSNGELLRIKPKVEHSNSESDDESEDATSDDDDLDSDSADVDLRENEEQLKVDEKTEAGTITNDIKRKLRDLAVDYARGEGILLTESSSEEESSEYDDEEVEIEHNWGELDKEADTTDEVTNRLAACNMDWDRIRAIDLMVLFNSFLPSGGLILSVTIYPSDFGLQRMKDEDAKGPIELIEAKNEKENTGEEDENEEGSKYHMEKLRQYQLNRLKYFYAVIVCDSPQTANKIYTDCDGIEYESTATKLDLRFIPDDMTFDQEPKEVCDKIPDLSKYQPRQFTTTALQQVKVELTWDETNPLRKEIAQKLNSGKIDDVDENDIQAYLASGSSDEEYDENPVKLNDDESVSESEAGGTSIDKYKLLLRSIEEQEEAKKNKDVEMEISWGLGTKEKSEKLVAERLKKDENLTPFEQYLEKRKAKQKTKREERKKLREGQDDESGKSDSEDSVPSDIDMNDPYFAEEFKNVKTKSKKQKNRSPESSNDEEEQRKAELELLLMDKNDAEGKAHFDMKKIEENESASKSKKKRMSKKKKKKDATAEEKVDDFEVNVSDPRFAALFSSHHFNIDPADSHYRKTKGTEALVNEKLKRRANEESIPEKQPKKSKGDRKMNAELAALVKSVKRKAQDITKPIK